MRRALTLSRSQILARRRRVQALDGRLLASAASVRQAAWAGLQDSMPRAALLSLHARVQGTRPSSWEDPALVQLWGPRYSAYAVPRQDVAVFSLGRLPEPGRARDRAEEMADRVDAFLDGRTMSATEIGRAIGIHPNALRYAAPTGRLLIRWDGARQPTVWTIPAPKVDPSQARLELARRYVHLFGPTTPAAFAEWAGITPPMAEAAFAALGSSILPVRTPIGPRWLLEEDSADAHGAADDSGEGVRLLPSGDTLYLLQGADRELLVPDPGSRAALWTSRVWPGALLVDGEISGTWRRAESVVTIAAWRALSAAARDAVEAEAASLPLPGLKRPIAVRWSD